MILRVKEGVKLKRQRMEEMEEELIVREKIKKIKEDIEHLRVMREANKRLDEEKDEEKEKVLDNLENFWEEMLECVEEIEERYERNKIVHYHLWEGQKEEFLNKHIERIEMM